MLMQKCYAVTKIILKGIKVKEIPISLFRTVVIASFWDNRTY